MKNYIDERCSFCGKEDSQVEFLFKGPNDTNICNECVARCQELMVSERDKTPIKVNLPTPEEMMAELDRYIVGQEDAKRVLCVAPF